MGRRVFSIEPVVSMGKSPINREEAAIEPVHGTPLGA
jgi:hypothetical protein